MKFVALAAFLLLLAHDAAAADRKDKVRALMEAEGTLAEVRQADEDNRAAGIEQGMSMARSFVARLHPDEGFRKRFELASAEFEREHTTPWTVDELVDVWARAYADQLSDAELDQLIAFYGSETYRRELAVRGEARIHMEQFLRPRYSDASSQAITRFGDRLRAIAGECHCENP